MFRLRKLMPLFVTVILAGLIILPMWAGETVKSDSAANEIATLEQLKAAFEKGGSYKVTADIVSDTYIEGYKDITLDLNGHTLSRENITASERDDEDRYFIIQGDGTLTLNNTDGRAGHIAAQAKQGAVNAAPRAVAVYAQAPDEAHPNGYHPKVIVNSGVKLVVEGNGNENSGAQALGVYTNYHKKSDKVVSTASAEINGGKLFAYDINGSYSTAYSRSLVLEGYGVGVKINDGKFNSVDSVVACYCGAELTINKGEFYSEHSGCLRIKNAFATIYDGKFDSSNLSYVCRVNDGFDDYPFAYDRGKLTIYGGEFSGDTPRSSSNAYIQIYGGTFNFDPQGSNGYAEEHFNGLVVGSATVTREGNKHVVTNTEKVLTTADEVINLLPRGGFFKLGADIELPLNNKLKLLKDITLDLNGHKLSKRTTNTSSTARSVLSPQDGKLIVKNTAEKTGEIQGIAEKDGETYGTPRAIHICTPSGNGNECCGRHVEVELNSGVKLSTVRADGGRSELLRANAIGIFMGDDYDSSVTPGGWNTKDNIKSTAKVTINDGVIIDAIGNAISVEDYGAYVVINGGEFTSKRYIISSCIGAEVTVNGGKFVADGESSRAVSVRQGVAKINGGTFTGKKNVIVLAEDQEYYPGATDISKAVVKGGTFNGDIELVKGVVAECDLQISGGKYTVDPTEWLAEGCTVVKEGDYFVVSAKPEPKPEPTPDKPEPPVIDPSVEIPEDIEKEPDVKPATKEDVPVFADSIEIAGNGTAYVKTDTAREIITKVFTSETIDTVTPLPIFKATVTEPNKVVAVSVNLKGSKIKGTADKIEDIDLRKLTSKTGALKYTRISDAAKAVDGTFMILDGFGKIASGEIKDNTVYQIVMFIEDNGKYDLDKTDKVVLDPATLVKTSETPSPSPSGSGGGGCNAGFGILALLFATPLFCRKKK